MLVMYVGWKLLKRTKIVGYDEMDLETDVYPVGDEDLKETERGRSLKGKVERFLR
jgi:AAT family amino acid transporter